MNRSMYPIGGTLLGAILDFITQSFFVDKVESVRTRKGFEIPLEPEPESNREN